MKTKELKKKLLGILESNSVNWHIKDRQFIRNQDYEQVVSEIIDLLIKNETV